MNKNKYAYCTSITRDFYIPCIILHKRIMDYLKVKYPLIVLVTEEVSENGIKEMEEYNIIIKKIQPICLQNIDVPLNYLKQTVINFSSLLLDDYDLIFNFEADMVFLRNLDPYFNIVFKNIFKNFYFFKENIKYKNNIFYEPKISYYFCKPDKKLYKNLIDFNCRANVKSDHCLMRTLFYNHFSLKDQKRVEEYKPTLHFRGHPKVWRGYQDYFSFINDIFLNKDIPIKKIFNFLKNEVMFFDETFLIGEKNDFEQNLKQLQIKYETYNNL